MSEPSEEQIKEAGQKAVDGFLAELGNEFGTGRFVLAAEVIDSDGEKFIYSSAGDGMKAWETLGILGYLSQVEQAEIVNDRLGG